MLSKSYCDDQAARLQAGMPRFNRDPRAAKEYADALYAVCRSNEVARRVIDDALETCIDVPTIADVRRMASEHNPPVEGEGCQKCGDSGYVVMAAKGYTAAAPCQCRLGRVIASGPQEAAKGKREART